MTVRPDTGNEVVTVPAKVKRATKMRAYPTKGQERRAIQLLRAFCEMYNAALQERRDAWKMNRVAVSYGDQSAQLKAIREWRPDLAEYSFTAEQQVLRRLRRSFDGFFRRVKAGQTPGFPRFRSHRRFDTADHVNGDGAKWVSQTELGGRWARAYFQGVGHIKVKQHRPINGRVTQISLKREGRRWYVIVISESEPETLAPTGRDVGVDVGIARFATTTDSEIIDNPRFLKVAADGLAELQQQLAQAKPGSSRYRLTKRRIAKLHRKTANRRRDFHHKTARKIVDRYDRIAVEDLQVANMNRRAKPKPDPDDPGSFLPNGAAAKTGLNRSIADAGWAQFLNILDAKAAWAGRETTRVDPAYSSITCHKCGNRCTRPRQDTVICPTHGQIDADLNGAWNIYQRAGLGSPQAA